MCIRDRQYRDGEIPVLNRAYVLSTLLGAAAFSFATSAAMAEPAKITVWSWDIAADALERAATTYMAAHPDVKIEVSDFAGTQIYDQVTAACSAGGEGMPCLLYTSRCV